MKRLITSLALAVTVAACGIFNPPPPPKPQTFDVDVVAVCGGEPANDAKVTINTPVVQLDGRTDVVGWVRFTLPKTAAGGAYLGIDVTEVDRCNDSHTTFKPNPLDGTDRIAGSGEFRVDLKLRPPPHLDAGERGRLKVDGLRFAREDGSTFPWRGFSDFSLFQRFVRGQDISGLVDERIALGVNIVRVFGMYNGQGIGRVNGLGEFKAQAVDQYYTRLTEFTTFLATRGLRVEFVVFADAQDLMPGFSEQQAHLDRVFTAIRESWNVVVELCNEPHKNGCHIDNLVIPASRPPVASGDYDLFDCRIGHLRDYVTLHTDRKDEWPRTARALGEVRDGADCLEAVRRPVVADEPMGFAEEIDPGRRVTSADDAAFFAGVAQQMGAGSTFHSNDGIASLPLRPVQKAAAQAWFWAARWVPVEAQFASYHRGSAGGGSWTPIDGPITHFDLGENGTGALRSYNKHVAGFEYAVAIRPEGGWSARPRRGCVVVDEPRRGFVKLRCP